MFLFFILPEYPIGANDKMSKFDVHLLPSQRSAKPWSISQIPLDINATQSHYLSPVFSGAVKPRRFLTPSINSIPVLL